MRTVRTPYVPYRAFGQLGGNTTTIVGGAGQGAAAGASVAGPFGAVVGGVIGAVAGIFGGQSNPQIQVDKTNAIQLFSQYTAVMGTVPGRSIGLENMDMILRGACFQGHFPGWGGQTELPDSLLSLPGSPYGQNDNCFAVLWSYAQTGRPAPGGSGQYTGNNNAPVKDAKTFVDKYVWPANSPNVDTDPWVTNTDAIGKQIIYDCADAYIASQTSGTTPYIANPQVPAAAAAPAPTPPPAPTPVPTTAPPTNPVTATSPPLPATTTAKPVQPPAPTNIETADGSQVTGPGVALETQAGTLIYFGAQAQGDPNNVYGYPMWENSTQNGYAVGLLMLNGGNVYAVNNEGLWYQWGANNWTQLAAAPSIQPAPTTSTVASPQSTVSTPVTTSGGATLGTTAVVGSTVAGEPISAADIQAMIQELQDQGATQAQANAAILQALQTQGASITPGLQSAVGSQVAQSLPTTTAAPASSNTGMYIVAGGLALVGLLWFMNRRAA